VEDFSYNSTEDMVIRIILKWDRWFMVILNDWLNSLRVFGSRMLKALYNSVLINLHAVNRSAFVYSAVEL
jgi:hypothetical protein